MRYIMLIVLVTCLSFLFGKTDSSKPVTDTDPVFKALSDMPPFKAAIVLETQNGVNQSRDTGTLYWSGKSCLIELSGEVILLRSDSLYTFLPGEKPEIGMHADGVKDILKNPSAHIKKNFDITVNEIKCCWFVTAFSKNGGAISHIKADIGKSDGIPSKVEIGFESGIKTKIYTKSIEPSPVFDKNTRELLGIK